MLKSVTLSADDFLIQKAKAKARKENKSLNQLFKEWLSQYTRKAVRVESFDDFMNRVNYVETGKKFSREEMNAR